MDADKNRNLEELPIIAEKIKRVVESKDLRDFTVKVNGATFTSDLWTGLVLLLFHVDFLFMDLVISFEELPKKFQAVLCKSKLAVRGKCGEVILTDHYWDFRNYLTQSSLEPRAAAAKWKPKSP